MTDLKTALGSLSVYRGVAEDGALRAFVRLLDASAETANARYADLLAELFAAGEEDFGAYLAEKVLGDENPFTRAAAAAAPVPPVLLAAAKRDLAALAAAAATGPDLLPAALRRALDPSLPIYPASGGNGGPLGDKWADADALLDYHKRHGYGKFLRSFAFSYDAERGDLVPVSTDAYVDLAGLKEYREEKAAIADNIESFLAGLPYADMLLYGDRGTGKSSTIHAMAKRYAPEGLRLVELPREHLPELLSLKALLASYPVRFLILIDDLALESASEQFSAFKSGLEGAAGAKCGNVMVAATSNRRHIVKESVSDSDDLHASDTKDELLSLSDRFGLTVLFQTTTRAEYLSVALQLLSDRGIDVSPEEAAPLAERWAVKKGGRSPRTARQFADHYAGRVKRGLPVEPF